MRAAVLHEIGKPPRAEDFQEPTAREGEVLLRVSATSLKAVDKQMAAGTHYASPREFPVICGSDGVGRLEDGTRVFFGGPRRPFGAMAEHTVVRRVQCFSLPENLDDATAAAFPNPGVSAWLSLTHIAKLVAGETVLVMGATGVAGKLAVQIARVLRAGRVIAAGRNQPRLNNLREFGADATIALDKTDQEVIEALRAETAVKQFDVIIDYLWGRPTELLLAALTKEDFAAAGSPIRLVEVGESAGPTIKLSGAVLRSSPVTILGTAGIPPWEVLTNAFQQVVNHAARGDLKIDVERVPLDEVEDAWQRELPARRIVLIP